MTSADLLDDVKKNLIIEHSEDDSLIQNLITTAISYAEGYQHKTDGWYEDNDMPQTTKQAVIIIASFLYESRDGSGGGFCRSQSADGTWKTANLLLRLERDWKV